MVAGGRFRGHPLEPIRRSVPTLPGRHGRSSSPGVRVLETLDGIEHVGSRLIAGPVDLPEGPLGPRRRSEALHRRPRDRARTGGAFGRSIPGVAGPARRAGDAGIREQVSAPLADTSAAGDRNGAATRPAFLAAGSPGRGHRRRVGPSAPSSSTSRRHAGRTGGSPPRRGAGLPLTGVGRTPTTTRRSPKCLGPHRPLEPMRTARGAVGRRIVPDTTSIVGPAAIGEARANLRRQGLVLARSAFRARHRTSCRSPRVTGRGFFQDVALRLERGHLASKSFDPGLFRLRPALPGKRLCRIGGELPNSPAEPVLVYVAIPRRLRDADAALRNQPRGLELERSAETSAYHAMPPVPSRHRNPASAKPAAGRSARQIASIDLPRTRCDRRISTLVSATGLRRRLRADRRQGAHRITGVPFRRRSPRGRGPCSTPVRIRLPRSRRRSSPSRSSNEAGVGRTESRRAATTRPTPGRCPVPSLAARRRSVPK